jgi:uncharacterized phage protein (TIGR01671 family)
MREILFRGKRLDNGEWVEGNLIVWSDGSCTIETGSLKGTMLSVDPATVGQFTGLTANGKRIFEGDIVNGLFLFERPIAGVVTFRDGSFGVQWMRGRVEEFSAFTSCCNVAWEGIGNVADNPELLEGGVNDG